MSKKFKIVDSLIIFSIVLSTSIENALAKRRIYNGVEVNIENFPWHAVIHYNGGFRCGGSIISESHILTAAHCAVREEDGARDDPAGFTIQYGANRLDDNSGSYARIRSVWVHESYDHVHTRTHDNDLAILFTSTPIQFSRFASATKLRTTAPSGGDRVVVSGHGVTETIWGADIAVAFTKSKLQLSKLAKVVKLGTREPVDGEYVTATGVGRTGTVNKKHVYSKVLRAVTERVYDWNTCKNEDRPFLNRNAFCLFTPAKYTCEGDSGSPIFISTGVQVGIVASGEGGLCDYPHLNSYNGTNYVTNVPHFRNWIDIVSGNSAKWVNN